MKPQTWLRPRYSLRRLFAIITVIALWLGWQEAVIRKRQQLCRMLEEQVGQRFRPFNTLPVARQTVNFDIEYKIYDFDDPTPGNVDELTTIPWYRKLLGDQPRYGICFPPEATPAEQAEFKQAFLEAGITRYPEKNVISADTTP